MSNFLSSIEEKGRSVESIPSRYLCGSVWAFVCWCNNAYNLQGTIQNESDENCKGPKLCTLKLLLRNLAHELILFAYTHIIKRNERYCPHCIGHVFILSFIRLRMFLFASPEVAILRSWANVANDCSVGEPLFEGVARSPCNQKAKGEPLE